MREYKPRRLSGDTRLTKRTLTAAAIILIAIPAVMAWGITALEDRQYYLISLLIIALSIVPFALIYERRRPQAREMVVIAVLTAVAVAGRAALYMIPQFKPVVAIVIITGVSFGGESGFITGALAGFISNMFIGQGPWTPWQMFSFGIIGFLAGILFKKGLLKRNRAALCVFGGISTFIIYGVLMDTASLFMFSSTVSWKGLLASYISGIPFNVIHAVATVFFLFILANPMLEKLSRIKKKYGILEP